jgi:hopanoid biosynthesis associated RND transporter like protein HpnN
VLPSAASERPNILARVVDACTRHPWPVLFVAALITTLSCWWVVGHFAMSTNASALISPDVKWRVDERALNETFPQNGNIVLVVIDGETPELAEAAAVQLTAKMTADTAHFSSVRRPDGGEFFARNGLLFASPDEVQATTARLIEAQPLLGPLAADPSLRGIMKTLDTLLLGVERGETKLASIDKPIAALATSLEAQDAGKPGWFSWQALLSADDATLAAPKRRLIIATPKLDFTALQPGAAAAESVRAAAQAMNLDRAHGVTVRLTGPSPLNDEEFASLAHNALGIAVAIVGSMLAVLCFATRSVKIVTAIMVTTLSGLAITAAIGLIVVGQFNLISVAFIPLFVGLGVDFGIQLGVRFQAERQREGEVAAAMRKAAVALGPSLLLAAGAVCLGFLAFLPTAYVGIAELGIISGLGMIIALVASATMLPALLVVLTPGPPPRETPSPRLKALDEWLLRRRGWVLGAFAVSMVATIAALPLVEFDFNPLHLKSPAAESVMTLADLAADPDRSTNTIDVLAKDLPTARALAAKLSSLPEVARVLTVESFVPKDQDVKLPVIADANMLLEFTLYPIEEAPPPSDAETVAALRKTATALAAAAAKGGAMGSRPGGDNPQGHAQHLSEALLRLADAPPVDRARAADRLVVPLGIMLQSLRDSLRAEPVTLETLPADIRRDWLAPEGVARVQLLPRHSDNASLEAFTAQVMAIAPDATGPAVSTQAAASTVATAFVQAGVLALAIVSVLLFAVLRSIREVAFTLAPVVLSGFLTLGTCVVIGQPINFANIIAFPLLFGVGVAFHIYFVMAWRGGATDLLQSSLAKGVFFSALATGMAFGALWLSEHPGTASMGKILMLSLAWTLVCALIFEPALLGPQKKPRAS